MSNERTCHASSSLRLFLCAFFIVAKGVLVLLLACRGISNLFLGSKHGLGITLLLLPAERAK